MGRKVGSAGEEFEVSEGAVLLLPSSGAGSPRLSMI